MGAGGIGDVRQCGDIHMAETFTEETHVLGFDVGKIVGKYGGYMLVIGALKGCTPAARDGNAKLHAGLMQIRNPRCSHPFHADVHRRQ